MEEFNFKRAELEDKEIISDYFRRYPSRSCERTFVNVFLWSRKYPVKWAVIDRTLVFKSEDEEHLSFAFPTGEEEDIKKVLPVLKAYCEERGYPFTMYNVTPENYEKLEEWFPGEYEIEYDRDLADYVYEMEKLATLSGKKLHGKRNHINKFKAMYENRWSYEKMMKDNLEDCFQMALKWRNDNGCNDDEEKNAEMCVTLNSLRLFEELELTGGVLRLDGEIIAFTMGEPVSEDTFVVHIEKAFADVQGAYPMINQQFVSNECGEYQYINREEDTGAEGLRKAKLSYRPVFLVEKGVVKENMIAEKMKGMVANSSAIRAMFEEGNRLAEIYGAENVYDFSLGNPNVPAPQAVKQAMIELLDESDPVVLHGYTNSNSGYADVRQTVAESVNERFGTAFTGENIVMTVGAAGGLNVIFKTLLNPGDEVIAFAPYFGEYRSYTNNYDGVLVEISPNTENFQPKLEEFEEKITPKTKIVIVNTPNNPTGVVYSEETIRKMTEIMEAKQKEYGTDIYLVSDEPYRELAYDGVEVPYLTKYYNNTIIGYSYSKSLSLPGERIGYLVIPDEVADSDDVKSAANVATRILGFVNAPTLQQKVVAKCINEKTDLTFYNRNRETLYNGLINCGFECIKPQGAFYLFVKSPVENEKAFCEEAKKLHILMVPGSSFACPGYVRLAYCVSYETIVNSLPKFQELAKKYF